MKRLWITIDTEMDADIHWKKHWPPTYTSIIEGIPNMLRPIWDEFDAHPIYFVSPEVLYSDECCEVLSNEISKGAIIGAHLHPEYIEPVKIWGKEIEGVEPQFPCYAYSTDIEREKIKNLTRLIEEKLNVSPEWYRAARFGADTDTINILRELGYKYDSSVTPYIDWSLKGGPNHSQGNIKPYIVAEHNIYTENNNNNGLIEMPVTIRGNRWGALGKIFPDNWLFYRWLRPTHMTCLELSALINEIAEEENIVMMFHSMEIMINKTPYVRNRGMQNYYLFRLRKSLEKAKNKGFSL